jgi:hypothetical protein
MSTPCPSADRNLLFGILALQMDFVSRDARLSAILVSLCLSRTSLSHFALRP